MSMVRGGALALAGIASLATAVTPAAAAPHGWRHGPRYGGYHRHHGSGVGGAIVGGLLIGGAVAAIASAAADDDDAPPPVQQSYAPPPTAGAYDAPAPGGYAEQGADTQGMAVDLCSETAEHESAPSARVNAITRVERDGGAVSGWRVDGVIDTGRTAMDGYRELGRFTCAVQAGRVVDLRFGVDGGPVALR